ncbi:MAG: putative glycoside hydrolase [Thermoleophilaceae bacterium]
MSARRFIAVVACCLPALFSSAPAFASTAAAGHFRYATDNAAVLPAGTANRNGVVVLKSGQTDKLRQLKAENPNVKVLVYKELAFTSSSWSSDSFYSASGVSYTDAQANNWFLHDTSGGLISSNGWGYLTALKVGNAAFQQKWAQNVVAELQQKGWDGVFMDDVNPTLKYHTNPSAVSEYPNDAAYQAAMASALDYIAPRVRGAGKLVMGNIGGWSEYYSVATSWLTKLDGAMWEHFAKTGTSATDGYLTGSGWQANLNMVKEAARQGKTFLGVSSSTSTDAAGARYGWATTLLGSGGKAYFSLAPDYTNETWFPEYDYDIGEATGDESTEANGVHRRVFTNGLVLVNPSTSSQSVSFGGSYSGSGLTDARSATMGPHSALVLYGQASPTTTTGGTTTGGTTTGGTTTGGTTTSGTTTGDTTTGGTSTGTTSSGSTASGTTTGTTSGTTTTATGGKRGGKKKVFRLVSGTVGRLSVLAGSGDSGDASLAWSRPARGSGVRRYRIFRNGTLIATVAGRRFLDRQLAAGARYVYRVLGVDSAGRVVTASRAIRVRGAGVTARAARVGTRYLRASLSSERRGLWRRAYVQRRVQVGGHFRWVRASAVRRARASTSFRIRAGRRAVVRIVVRSSRHSGRSLHSAALELRA